MEVECILLAEMMYLNSESWKRVGFQPFSIHFLLAINTFSGGGVHLYSNRSRRYDGKITTSLRPVCAM